MGVRLSIALRPAIAPGEDRNILSSDTTEPELGGAAPGHRAGRGSQPAHTWDIFCEYGYALRPAIAPGEDRNAAPRRR